MKTEWVLMSSQLYRQVLCHDLYLINQIPCHERTYIGQQHVIIHVHISEIPVPKHVVIESDTTSLSVKWMKPDGLDEVSYQLTLNRNEEGETIFTDSLEHCFRGLLPGTKYSVGVATALNDGQSKNVLNTICTCKNIWKHFTLLPYIFRCTMLFWYNLNIVSKISVMSQYNI